MKEIAVKGGEIKIRIDDEEKKTPAVRVFPDGTPIHEHLWVRMNHIAQHDATPDPEDLDEHGEPRPMGLFNSYECLRIGCDVRARRYGTECYNNEADRPIKDPFRVETKATYEYIPRLRRRGRYDDPAYEECRGMEPDPKELEEATKAGRLEFHPHVQLAVRGVKKKKAEG